MGTDNGEIPRPRVLIATNDPTLTPSLARSYSDSGFDVVLGMENIYLSQMKFDLLHLHWPEELLHWRQPDERSLAKLSEALTKWRKTTPILATAHNLRPHSDKEHPLDKRLYEIVYRNATVIGHFSNYSRDKTSERFPDIPADKHLVHCPHSLDNLAPFVSDRVRARAKLGIPDDTFVLLGFGAFRHSSELNLLMRADRSLGSRKRLFVFAGRLPTVGGLRRRGIALARFELWKFLYPVKDLRGFIPDEEIGDLLVASDVIVIPRSGVHLNSGLLPLAMMFGTPVVAPGYGAYEEYLGGTDNELYRPDDAASLAEAVRRISQKDRAVIAAANKRLAAQWGWDNILSRCLPELRKRQGETVG